MDNVWTWRHEMSLVWFPRFAQFIQWSRRSYLSVPRNCRTSIFVLMTSQLFSSLTVWPLSDGFATQFRVKHQRKARTSLPCCGTIWGGPFHEYQRQWVMRFRNRRKTMKGPNKPRLMSEVDFTGCVNLSKYPLFWWAFPGFSCSPSSVLFSPISLWTLLSDTDLNRSTVPASYAADPSIAGFSCRTFSTDSAACLGVAGFHLEICPFLPLFFSLKFAPASFIRLTIGVDWKSLYGSEFNPRAIKLSSAGITVRPIGEASHEIRSCACGTNGEMKFKRSWKWIVERGLGLSLVNPKSLGMFTAIEWYLFHKNGPKIIFESSL
jgi:hypothetical protein